ncbi:MAG: peptide ABC transporter substrate-binding protein [Phycisphaeraceae bacterium]|nr:peptide ABC transporter substrate-binding protein [Phycisphaerales bacterium]MCB9860331.1 peptide ABC transporter substrate-binding protein [Phycisphaeraceae bacterium]
MVKIAVPFLLLLAVLGVMVVTDKPSPKADFTFINRGDVTTLDFQKMSWMQDLRVARMIGEGLVRHDTFTWEYHIVPGVASSWEISPDQLTYTFHLRDNAKWSNGTPVTAHDFVYSWRRALLPDTAADYTGLFQVIVGAEDFFEWRSRALDGFQAKTVESIDALDDLATTDAPDAAKAIASGIWLHIEQRGLIGESVQGEQIVTLRKELDALTEDFDLVSKDGPTTEAPNRTASRIATEIHERLTSSQALLAPVKSAIAGNPYDAHKLWTWTEQQFHDMVQLHATDDHTLTFTLSEPTPYFLDLCAFAVFFPVYPPLVQRYESVVESTGMLKSESGWTKPPYLITNGPMKLTTWRFKRDMFFERNEHYWDQDLLNVDTMKIVSVDDGNAQVLAFETGSVDWVSDVGPTYKADMLARKMQFYKEHQAEYDALLAAGYDQFEIDRRLPDDDRKNIHAIPAFGTYWYNFNCLPKMQDGRDNPFVDPRVRRAFAMCIDKKEITERVNRIGQPVARTIIPPNSIGGYTSPKGLKCISDATNQDERNAIIAEARALLAEAGYPDPSQFPTVEILFNKDGGHGVIAEAVQRHWIENLGVPVILQLKEIKIFRDDLKKQNFMVSRAGWYGDYGDPTTFLDLSRSTDGNNDRKYNNPHFDGLLDQARKETDPEKRMEILEECERIIMEDDLPMVPLFHYITLYLFDADEMSGLNPHPRTEQNLFMIDMLKDGKGPDVPSTMPLKPVTTEGGEL